MDRLSLLMVVITFMSVFIPIALVFLMTGKQWKEAQEKARERRMAEHRMNARLLRFNI